jgi:hypothetical protein
VQAKPERAQLPDDRLLVDVGFFIGCGIQREDRPAIDKLVACPGTNTSPGEGHYQGILDQTAGSIACGHVDTLSEVVWTNDTNTMLASTQSLDDVPRHFQWWLADG